MKKLLFLFIATAFFYACPIELDDDDSEFCNKGWANFEIPVSFIPADGIIHLGDTITIFSTIKDTMRDLDHNELYFFDSVKFYLHSGFTKIDTFNGSNITSSVKLFDYIIDTAKYDFQVGKVSVIFEYEYKNHEYSITYKVIPKYKGVFIFEFFSDLLNLNNLEKKPIYAKAIDCETTKWNVRFKTNNGKNNNREFLKLSPLKRYNSYYYNAWSRNNNVFGAHCFKVVE